MANGNGLKLLSPLGQLVTIISTIVAASLAVTVQLYSIKLDIQQINNDTNTRLLLIEQKLATLPPRDMWRGQDMVIFGHELSDKNDGLHVPDPRQILRDRMMEHDAR